MGESIYRDSRYLAANPNWHEEDSSWKASQVLKIFERNGLRPGRIADIGCGAGAVLDSVIAALDARGVGYDIAPDALALASQRARDKLSFRQQDILETSELFDAVLALDVLEHVDDYIGFLRRLRAYGRHHVFHVPLDMNVANVARSRPILKTREQVGHLHYFMKDTALATLEYSGYRIDDWFYTSHLEVISHPTLLWKMARLPRAIGAWINQDLSARFLGGVSLMVLCHAAEQDQDKGL